MGLRINVHINVCITGRQFTIDIEWIWSLGIIREAEIFSGFSCLLSCVSPRKVETNNDRVDWPMDPSHAVAHSAASHRGTHVPLLSEPIDPQSFVRATLLSRVLDGVPQKYRHPDLWPGQLDDVNPVASPAPFRAFEDWGQLAGVVELIAAGSSVPPIPLLPQPAPIDYRNPCCATGLGTASPSPLTHCSRTMPSCSHACTCSGTYIIVEFSQAVQPDVPLV